MPDEQPADVLPVQQDDERGQAHEEQDELAALRVQQVHRRGQHQRRDDARERDVAAHLDQQDPGHQRGQEGPRGQAEHHSRPGGHALPPAKLEEHREDVTDDRGGPEQERHQVSAAGAGREDQHRHRPLEHVEETHRHGVLPA